jgi:hypothetical protein
VMICASIFHRRPLEGSPWPVGVVGEEEVMFLFEVKRNQRVTVEEIESFFHPQADPPVGTGFFREGDWGLWSDLKGPNSIQWRIV